MLSIELGRPRRKDKALETVLTSMMGLPFPKGHVRNMLKDCSCNTWQGDGYCAHLQKHNSSMEVQRLLHLCAAPVRIAVRTVLLLSRFCLRARVASDWGCLGGQKSMRERGP